MRWSVSGRSLFQCCARRPPASAWCSMTVSASGESLFLHPCEADMFHIAPASQKMATRPDPTGLTDDATRKWTETLFQESRARYASEAPKRALEGKLLEEFVRDIFEKVSGRAVAEDGVRLPEDLVLTVLGDLSGLGPLMAILADDDVEDIAINLGSIYVYKTLSGWEYYDHTP